MNSTLFQTNNFILRKTERSAIEHILNHYDDYRAASIEALKIIQKERGWVPDGALYAISKILSITTSDVEGVATFYSQIFRQPVGRHIIRVCDSITCYIGGYESVISEIKNKHDIDLGQTTQDNRFTLLPVCCLGNCDKAPALMIDDDTFGDMRPAGVIQLLESYL
ncbi:NADH-quinone oxidoreductase subunit NuoE [Candidatus Pseudomonas adelgestsugas]|uniref:NADH-quinone oxidoreductase subunit E n=1 Tax=Candidatus Pseudomonas adelgestsugas TaxID=1302376 RepID=A0ABX5R8N2_9PSED|nr:NADH-quinone oxidoreductase subunit NuoE [Candidatus Pseudomonas adelgestsugas]QAX81787.1 NADH-quinone oxidoreductase subunit E [Candidatus Pseudomonas adelgestsugas]